MMRRKIVHDLGNFHNIAYWWPESGFIYTQAVCKHKHNFVHFLRKQKAQSECMDAFFTTISDSSLEAFSRTCLVEHKTTCAKHFSWPDHAYPSHKKGPWYISQKCANHNQAHNGAKDSAQQSSNKGKLHNSGKECEANNPKEHLNTSGSWDRWTQANEDLIICKGTQTSNLRSCSVAHRHHAGQLMPSARLLMNSSPFAQTCIDKSTTA